MKKILNFLLNIFELPIVLPIMVLYQLYVVIMIVRQSNQADLYEIDTPDGLESYVKPHTDNFFNKYKYFMYAFSIIFWLQLIKYIILQIYGI
jgi:hypothetical protein